MPLLYALCLTGCAAHSESFRAVEKNLANQQPQQALEALDKQKGARADEVLYLLNKAMLLRIAGDYRASIESFELAQQRMEALSALSLREQGASFIINDSTRSYVGEPFEQVMVSVYKALNYLQLGDRDGARVEALQIDLKLRAAEGKHLGEAFARYLTGIIYEDLGEWSDAMIAYRKAYEGYRKSSQEYRVDVPGFLKEDLLRLASILDLKDELEKYRQEFAVQNKQSDPPSAPESELIFVLSNGLAPAKRENSVAMMAPSRVGAGLVRISLPYFESRVPSVSKAYIRLEDRGIVAERVENVDAIAIATLSEQMPEITARGIARVVAKRQVAMQIGKNNKNDALAVIADVIGFITERADTRSWSTLPYDIHLARFPLGVGSYTIKIELRDRGDNIVATREFHDVLIHKGKKTYLSYHWINL